MKHAAGMGPQERIKYSKFPPRKKLKNDSPKKWRLTSLRCCLTFKFFLFSFARNVPRLLISMLHPRSDEWTHMRDGLWVRKCLPPHTLRDGLVEHLI
jgi:hypothetical protein